MKKPQARPAPAPSRYGLSVLAGSQMGQRFRLGGAGCMAGRTRGALLFPDDPHLEAHHATFLLKDGGLFVRDEASLSGVLVSAADAPQVLVQGAFFAAGQRLFRYLGQLPAPPPQAPDRPSVYGAPLHRGQPLFALEEVLVGGRSGKVVATQGPQLTIGQQHCDLSYPKDPSLALRHCELSFAGALATLRDLSLGLGTFVRTQPLVEHPLHPGDRIRMGQQVLQVEEIG